MLIDTGSDISILKVDSLHDDVTIYCGEQYKLTLTGISGKITTLGEADCHIMVNDEIIEHTVHIVPVDFQLQADGIIGIDLLNRLGATIYCKEKIIEIGKLKSERLAPHNKVQISTEHLNSEEKFEVIELCNKYKDVFRKLDQQLSCTNTLKHEIPVSPDHPPVNQRPYRLPEAQKPLVEQHIQEMKVNGIIRDSTSPWNSPIVIVPKKGGKTRFCTDYRKLNEITKGDAHPLPNITEILDQLGGMQYFLTLDLSSGFHQIEIMKRIKKRQPLAHPKDILSTNTCRLD